MSGRNLPPIRTLAITGQPAQPHDWWPLAVGMIAMTILLWPSRGVVPLFDGWSFARCALDASWVAVRCEGHPTVGWGVVMAASRLWSIPGATALFLPSLLFRSEERRVGKECRSRWSPYH